MRLQFKDITLWYSSIEPADGESRREAETRTVAMLVREAFGAQARLGHRADGSPVIEGECCHISVSHSRSHAVVAVGSRPVGVDIEEYRTQLERVLPRVLTTAEMEAFGGSPEGMLRAWTLKEALYKAAGVTGADFRRQIHIADSTNPCVTDTQGLEKSYEILFAGYLTDGIYMSLVAGEPDYSLVP